MKIIHTADNHLGAPLTGFSPQAARARKDELTDTFFRLLRYAETEGVDAVFLCGDLFDSSHPSPTLLREVTDAIAACPAQIFFVTGNHDDGVVFPYAPDNFHRFDKGLKSYRLGEITVTGADYGYVGHPLWQGLRLGEETCNFLLLHGDIRQSFSLEKGSIDLSALAYKNIDYLALGHIHSAPPFARIDGRGVYGYSGTLEGHGFDECGATGFVLIDTSGGLRHSFQPFGYRTYHEISLDVSGAKTYLDLQNRLFSAVERLPQKDGVKICLKGTALDGLVRVDRLQSALAERFFAAKIVDESVLAVDYSKYAGQKTLKGELVRLAAALPEEEREGVLSLAFRALGGEDLDV